MIAPAGPAPPPPQCEAQRRPGEHVEEQQGPVEAVTDLVGQRHAANGYRKQKQCGVDDPVAPRAGRGRRLVLVRADEPAEAKTESGHDCQGRRRNRG